MCCCNCDPCWACGTRPTQGIISGSVLSYSTPENGTYDVYTYGQQDTEQLTTAFRSIHTITVLDCRPLPRSAGICSAFNSEAAVFCSSYLRAFSTAYRRLRLENRHGSQPYGTRRLTMICFSSLFLFFILSAASGLAVRKARVAFFLHKRPLIVLLAGGTV